MTSLRRTRPAETPGGHPPAVATATAPLLFAFVAPTLGVVGLVGWLATGAGTWLAVGVALALVIIMMAAVMVLITRFLADDRDV